jgi:hypothetical protein
MDDTKLIQRIILIVVCTLALICVGMVGVLLDGLFDDKVDNEKIFAIIGPAFNTVIGAFVGLLGGLSLNKSNKCSKE